MVSFTNLLTAGLLATTALAVPHNMHMHRDLHKMHKRTSTKRGAAYNDVSTVTTLAESGTISWAYNWVFTTDTGLPSGVEYVPMLWGTSFFSGWLSAIETILSSGSDYIMGFNEPDMASQADMTPSVAAGYYMQYITPFSGSAKLISPAVTSSSSDGQGLSWFEEFMTDCSSCNITGLAVHWYGDSVDDLKTFVTDAITTASNYGLEEVWVTEFALNADISGVVDQSTTAEFVTEAITWLDAQSGVTRYSYFMCADNYLLTDGALNSVGSAYTSTSV
ncbi:Glycoside hydrolase superfamily [Penicillium tannophilum]|nr:Glycoside hydrolase superfamily [Penicillium tannophilum]